MWDSIVQEQNGIVSINLLLNRRSPWVDIESSLPYRGKVNIDIKKARQMSIRIPNWVDKSTVKISIKGKTIEPVWVGNYLSISNPPVGASIKINFPVKESVEHYSIDSYQFRGTEYLGRHTFAIEFRGNTAIDIQPKGEAGYRTYTGDSSFNQEAPRTAVSDYVAMKRIAW
ncbi:MAG: hypothetical protein HYX78_10700 [Armatimonadetes bacterium]|nr:hypothetical protein [Armatimonadota bacterium]